MRETNRPRTVEAHLECLEPRLLLAAHGLAGPPGQALELQAVTSVLTTLAVDAGTINENGGVLLTGAFDSPLAEAANIQLNWGDGSTQTLALSLGATGFSAPHTFLDDNPTGTPSDIYTISAAIEGTASLMTTSVTVNNVAPTISLLSLDSSVIDENGTVNLTGTFTDPGTLDTFVVVIDWGDGNSQTLNVAAGVGNFAASHQYLDDDPTGTPSDVYAIGVSVTDDDTGVGSLQTNVTVNNVAPTVGSLTLDSYSIDENGTATLTGTFTDPGTLDTFVVVIDWGDGGSETLNVAAGTRDLVASHQYLDDNPSGTPSDVYTIGVTVTDDDTGAGTGETEITVNNVPPVIVSFTSSAPGVGDVAEGKPVAVTGQFTDVGTLDTHVAVIDWGDGTTSPATLTETGGSGSFTAQHVYTAGGIYTITATVTDDDTGADSASAMAVVSGIGIHNGVLQIIGTLGNDSIKINQTGNGKVKVHANFIADKGKQRNLNLAGVQRIEILLGDGNDTAQMSGNMLQSTLMSGGSGSDRLNAGNGPAILLGGSGNDFLNGGRGRNVMIGGLGGDRIVGGPGDDILIGGRTTFDIDDNAVSLDYGVALRAILDEWNSAGSFDQRVANLSGLGTGGLNGQSFLVPGVTILDGQTGDKLTGASGNNWLPEQVSAKKKGTITLGGSTGSPGNNGNSSNNAGSAGSTGVTDTLQAVTPILTTSLPGNGNGQANGHKI